MARWSAENATNAYLHTVKMCKEREKQPDEAEFISALAAGTNAQLMVEICAPGKGPGATTFALLAAAHQTGGRVVCVLTDAMATHSSPEMAMLQAQAPHRLELVVGDGCALLVGALRGADFVVGDCRWAPHESVVRTAEAGAREGGVVVFGRHAFDGEAGLRHRGAMRSVALPIGGGVVVTRIKEGVRERKRSKWVVRVDKFTGEEHVYRVPVGGA
ncbi:uncharacterized protein LOC18441576 [Amborella trichopoda]|uniref:Uncharacterized protein n=1 Tax=Amborella trichopoda TaxID=13333 RepID=W1Q0A7_AMBTC|nr:uncharacterized protein LOC18441576 [Amborella trichopoda]ERN13335.1 hypothetical protein AMTR_s00041p00104830 [Amborella trichopoda]|eukprot:XP_006851868.1 uncharacterized protein LOC18441576 [Amborella trichopoda]